MVGISRAIAIAVAACAVVAVFASPAAAAPSPSSDAVPSASADDKNLPKKYTKFVPLKIVSTDTGEVSAASLPSGCGLYVTLSRAGNTLHSSLLTQCLSSYELLRTWGTLSRSRWYGWESMASGENRVEGRTGVTESFDYDCSGTGTHDFKVVGNGYLVSYNGDSYTAAAYDEIDDVSC